MERAPLGREKKKGDDNEQNGPINKKLGEVKECIETLICSVSSYQTRGLYEVYDTVRIVEKDFKAVRTHGQQDTKTHRGIPTRARNIMLATFIN